MRNKTIDIKRLLTENNKEIELKNYIYKIKEIFGEDYAVALLTSDINIEKSLHYFTSKLRGVSSINIESIMFQSAILSPRNKYHFLFEERTNEDFWWQIFIKIQNDMTLKKN